MADNLTPLPSGYLDGVWATVLEHRLRLEVATAREGQRLRVDGIGKHLLEAVAANLSQDSSFPAQVFMVDSHSGPEPWRVSAYKVVESRNPDEGIVLALVPPDAQLTAGDSIDKSTFREISVAALAAEVEGELLGRMEPAVADRARAVLLDLEGRKWRVSSTDRLRFLALLASQHSAHVNVGGALYAVGLVPDFDLFADPALLRHNLGQHNIQSVVAVLSEASRTTLDRVMRLSITDERFRQRFIAFLDGTDPGDIRRWGERAATEPGCRDFALDRWPLELNAPPGEVQVFVDGLKLPIRDDGMPVYDPNEKLTVAWRTTPQAADVPGLSHFRVEMVRSDGAVAWESALVKVTRAQRRSKQVTGLDLEPDVYFVRVVALTEAGDPFSQGPRDAGEEEGKATNETDDFVLLPTDETDPGADITPAESTSVSSFAEAELIARLALISRARRKDEALPEPAIAWVTAFDDVAEQASAAIRFETYRQFTLRVSQRLRRLEVEILSSPDNNGAREIDLRAKATAPWSVSSEGLPEEVAAARRVVFDRIASSPVAEGAPVVAVCDLADLAQPVADYLHAYTRWLQEDPAALELDLVTAHLPDVGTVVLVPPTHPLRLMWLVQEHRLARAWATIAEDRGEVPRDLLSTWRKALVSTGLPGLLVLRNRHHFTDAGPLPGGWSAYLAANVRDTRSALSILRHRLGAGPAHATEADLAPSTLADRLEAFLRQHPYASCLVLNVVNPGDGGLVVEALTEVENRLGSDADIRYQVRLFSEREDPRTIGQAFRDLMDPDRQQSDAAARLAGPGRSVLFPKLSWLRKPLRSFVETPEQFPAHITLLLDHFRSRLGVAREDDADRTSYLHGLIQDVPQRFVGRGDAVRWIRRPSPTPCPEIGGAEDSVSTTLANALTAMGRAQARRATADSATDPVVAVTELDLDLAAQSLLYSAHAISTWVLTVDANLGIDYFDGLTREERPGYLLDFTPEFSTANTRQLLLTTRVDAELLALVEPLLEPLGVDTTGPSGRLIIESLRALSGRLALRLASHPYHRQGVFGMALAKLFLEAVGALEGSIVIPLDAHPELSRRQRSSHAEFRSDLLLVSAMPEHRRLDMLVVEVKTYSGAGLGDDLRARIDEQTEATATALRERFQIAEVRDRVDRQVQSWRLTSVLSFYLERARRYQLINPEAADEIRPFLSHLDGGYDLSVRRTGVVFRLDAASTSRNDEVPGLPIWVVGRDMIDAVLVDGLATYDARVTTPTRDETTPPTTDRSARSPAYGEVSADFAGLTPTLRKRALQGNTSDVTPSTAQQSEPAGAPAAPAEEDHRAVDFTDAEVGEESAKEPVSATLGESSRADWIEQPDGASEPTAAESEGAPEVEVLLGDNKLSAQFGVLGLVAAEPHRRVGIDLNGVNTVSVFGVQGGGKSYTLGSVIEMAVRPLPKLNRLPQPLGAVVFHYHQTQDYPPEFVSMVRPNDEPDEVNALASLYDALPAAVDDVVVLTTADTVDQRRAEFPGVAVQPIAFASSELTVADWRFLMGATGNDSLYLKQVNEVMRASRRGLSLTAIRQGIAASQMTDAQRALATARLDLAERFIDDSASLRSLLHAGRVIVVDLRDEFVEKDEALGLFVTMLNVFAGAGLGDEPFNKLIVFDEAHKYMGGALIGHVVEVIREMRHKGVSVVVASQDPVNVPQAVVELSSVVVLHRFNSPNWLKHIQKSLTALADLTSPMLSGLGTGEAFVWSSRATDATFTRRSVKLRMRPRASKHGGSTKKAVD